MATREIVEQTLFTAIPAIFSVFHLLLFAFSRKDKKHLYFAVLTLAFAVAAYCEFLLQGRALENPVVGLQRTAVLILIMAAVRFYYALHDRTPPRLYTALLIVTAAGAAIGWLEPRAWTTVLVIIVAATVALTLRFRATGIERGEGRWILVIGLLLAAAGGVLDLLMDIGLPEPPIGDNPWLYGGLGLLASMSVYLAFSMELTSRRLTAKLVEVRELSDQMLAQERAAREEEVKRRLLEADNRRKGEELAAARDLQLSMLPQRLPQSDDWEVAARMITATEVGGDYYDFDLSENGALTVAVGDAVGHGARAGALVAATKSLFSAGVSSIDLATSLEHFDKALGKLAAGRLFVSLLLARLDRGRLEVASAGMPPPLVLRHATGRVEELSVAGTPLGSPIHSAYSSHELRLEPGDTVLFMTDGLPELTDDAGEELGYEGATQLFESLADQSAESLVHELVEAVAQRTGGEPPEDDVTFVAVRLCGSGYEDLPTST